MAVMSRVACGMNNSDTEFNVKSFPAITGLCNLHSQYLPFEALDTIEWKLQPKRLVAKSVVARHRPYTLDAT